MPATGPTAQNNPDAFVGRVTLSAYEPYPMFTGSAVSSLAPASAGLVHWNQPSPMIVKNIVLQNSMAAGVPAATSQASSGSEAFSYGMTASLYSRQDYTSNSTNLAPLQSASFGLTATLSYTSTAQTFGMSWVTDTTGGVGAFSTTSSDAGWSNYANGNRVFSLPFVGTLTAGEYWLALQHSSTTATSNSNVTLLSMSQYGPMLGQQALQAVGTFGQSTAVNSLGLYGANQNAGLVAAPLVFTTTMALSSVQAANRHFWFALSNA